MHDCPWEASFQQCCGRDSATRHLSKVSTDTQRNLGSQLPIRMMLSLTLAPAMLGSETGLPLQSQQTVIVCAVKAIWVGSGSELTLPCKNGMASNHRSSIQATALISLMANTTLFCTVHGQLILGMLAGRHCEFCTFASPIPANLLILTTISINWYQRSYPYT